MGTWSVLMATALGTMGLPHVLVRFHTSPDGRAARRTAAITVALLGAFYLVPAVYGLLKGRMTACFPPITGDMENAGATVIDAPDVVDGNLVSCRGWPDMPQFGRAMMELFTKSVSSAST